MADMNAKLLNYSGKGTNGEGVIVHYLCRACKQVITAQALTWQAAEQKLAANIKGHVCPKG